MNALVDNIFYFRLSRDYKIPNKTSKLCRSIKNEAYRAQRAKLAKVKKEKKAEIAKKVRFLLINMGKNINMAEIQSNSISVITPASF